MFFEKNQKLLIATGAVALLWVILYYVLVAPNWETAAKNEESAQQKRQAWETSYKAIEDKKDAKKEGRKNDFKTRSKAEAELNQASEIIDAKLKESRKIEFGTSSTLRVFSIAAVGKGGDTKNLLNQKLKDTKDRANTILKSKLDIEKLSVRFGDEGSSDALNLLRLAMVDRFLTACKEVKDPNTKDCKIEEIAAVDYFKPEIIPLPDEEKVKNKEKSPDEEEAPAVETKKAKPKKKGDKDKDDEKLEEIDRLVQIPMKVVVRSTERYITQLLYELGQPTSGRPDSEDRRGYFCVKGFHVSVANASSSAGEKLLEMSVAVSALLRESEVKALSISLKKDNRSRTVDSDGY